VVLESFVKLVDVETSVAELVVDRTKHLVTLSRLREGGSVSCERAIAHPRTTDTSHVCINIIALPHHTHCIVVLSQQRHHSVQSLDFGVHSHPKKERDAEEEEEEEEEECCVQKENVV
jgi:hypothetical protein